MKRKQQRLARLFDSRTSRSVTIPMDHGVLGVLQGLEDPLESLLAFAELGVESLLVNYGVAKLARPLLREMESPPALVMAADFNLRWPDWKTPLEDGDVILGHCSAARVEQALEYGADAVKVYFALGLEPAVQLEVIRNTCELIREADRHGMPVMIEPVTDGKYIPDERKRDSRIIEDGCRLAVELGADIIKAPFYGDSESFAAVCRRAHVPVIMLGGVKRETVRPVFQTAKEGIACGAAGVIFGRNVWQRPRDEMRKVVRGLQDIVHRDAGAEETLRKYGLQ